MTAALASIAAPAQAEPRRPAPLAEAPGAPGQIDIQEMASRKWWLSVTRSAADDGVEEGTGSTQGLPLQAARPEWRSVLTLVPGARAVDGPADRWPGQMVGGGMRTPSAIGASAALRCLAWLTLIPGASATAVCDSRGRQTGQLGGRGVSVAPFSIALAVTRHGAPLSRRVRPFSRAFRRWRGQAGGRGMATVLALSFAPRPAGLPRLAPRTDAHDPAAGVHVGGKFERERTA